MCLLTVVAEDRELDEGKIMLSGSVGEQDRKKIDEVLKEFEDLLDGSDDRFTGGEMTRAGARYQGHFSNVHIDCQIFYETQLSSNWMIFYKLKKSNHQELPGLPSPMVPVPKLDGTTRLCIDY